MKFENLADSGDLIEVARSGKIVRILGWDQLCWLCSRTNPILGAQHCQSHPQGIKPRLPSYLLGLHTFSPTNLAHIALFAD